MPLVREANASNEPNSDLKQGWPRADKAAGTAAIGTSRLKQSQFRDRRAGAGRSAGGLIVQNEANSGSSGFSVLVGCRPPSRGRCPRTPGICRFGPIAWQEDPEARLSCGADFRAALAATPGRPAGPSPSTPKELACPAVFIMLLAKSVKCRGLGRSPKRYRSTLKPDEPIFPDAS
jgi:hypothetical protein